MVLISQRLKDESGQPIVSTQRTQIMAAQPKEYWIDVAEFCELFKYVATCRIFSTGRSEAISSCVHFQDVDESVHACNIILRFSLCSLCSN